RRQYRPLAPSRPLPAVAIRADGVDPPIRGPYVLTHVLGTTNRVHVLGHVAERDEGRLGLPNREGAAREGTLQQESVAYQSRGPGEIVPHTAIRQVHRNERPEVLEPEPCRNADHPEASR